MVPSAGVLFVSVKERIVRDGDRLQPKRRVVFDANDGWRCIDQFFEEPIIVAVNINGQDANLGKFRLDEAEIFER